MYSLTPIYTVPAAGINFMGYLGVVFVLFSVFLLRLIGTSNGPSTDKGKAWLRNFFMSIMAIGAIWLGVFTYSHVFLVGKLVPQHQVKATLMNITSLPGTKSRSGGNVVTYTIETGEVVVFNFDFGEPIKQERMLYVAD